jgi:hypothetical protein
MKKEVLQYLEQTINRKIKTLSDLKENNGDEDYYKSYLLHLEKLVKLYDTIIDSPPKKID